MATSTSADGLPMSLRYRLLARRGDHPGPGGLGMTAVVLLAAPLTGAIGRLLGRGDILHAVAYLPESQAGEADRGSLARQELHEAAVTRKQSVAPTTAATPQRR